MIRFLVLIVIGTVAGLIKGFTSSSGVMIVVPILKIFFNFPVHHSIGTSLFVDFLSSLAISAIFYKYKNLDIKSGIWIALGSILGAQVGVIFAVQIPELPLGISFSLVMILTGWLLIRKEINREKIVKRFQGVIRFHTQEERIITAIFLGFLVGILSGMLGAGGGIMILLILVFVLGFPLQKGLGTAIFIMAITSLSGTLGYSVHREIYLLDGTIISLGAIIAGVLGAIFANKISEERLNKIVGGIFLSLGLAMGVFLFLERIF